MPFGGRSVNLTSPYSITVKNDSVISSLPYFGRAYHVPYGGGNGLQFKAPLTSYETDFNKRGAGLIKMKTTNNEDTYTFTITVQTNGSAYVTVNMHNRQTISYDGELDMGYEEQTTSLLPDRPVPEKVPTVSAPVYSSVTYQP